MAKKNGKIIWTIGTIIGIFLAAGGVIWGFAIQSGNLVRAVIDVKVCAGTVADSNKAIAINKLELVGVKKDIGFLSEKVDRNYTVQQQILDEIKELR